MQYLYGSGEASAISIQAYRALWNYLKVEIGYRRDKSQINSVVLSRGATLTSPKFDQCGKRKLAVVLDVDETALLNLGFEADAAARPSDYDPAKWARWEQTGADKVVAVPGAADTLAAARGEGITVIFNSNRTTASAAQTAAAIEGAGLGPAVLGDTLWLRDEGAPSGKDERRWKIAETYCIVAMVGDQLGDFSDLFNTGEYSVGMRRNMTSESLLATLWGAGWFVLPNPVYGSALHGGLDDVFPKDKQWADPAEEKK
ncbi:MAG: acid phosphatase [Sphingomonadales bacterium]|nr:MAG: acid phosphatase [Sphingomonadales bacterium]